MKKIIFLFALLGLFAMACGAFAQNIVVNPGFEDDSGVPPAPWIVYGGPPNAAFAIEDGTLNPDRVHSGLKSFSITGTPAAPIVGSNGPRQWAIPIDKTGGTKYRWSAWIKKTAQIDVVVRWHVLDGGGNAVDSGYGTWDTSGAGGWFQITNGPSAYQPTRDASYICITIYARPGTGTGGTGVGSVYIDDLAVTGEPSGVNYPLVKGTVRDTAGNPFRGWVCWSQTPNATTEPTHITRTLDDGTYALSLTAGTWYVSAWEHGFKPVEVQVQSRDTGGDIHQDLQFTTPIGVDLALPDGVRVPTVTAQHSWPSQPPTLMINGNYVGGSAWGSNQNQSIVVDLDPAGGTAPLADGISIFWCGGRTSDYTVELSANGTDFTQVYAMSGRASGFQVTDGIYCLDTNVFLSYIPFPSQPVRKARLTLNAHSGWDDYTIWEFMVHSATQKSAVIFGRVTDENTGEPIDRALVSLGDGKFLTDPTGYFYKTFFSPLEAGADSYKLFTADAWQYANKDQLINLGNTGAVVDCALTPKAEQSVVPNFDMETIDSGSGIPVGYSVGGWSSAGTTLSTVTPGHGGTGKCLQADTPSMPGWEEFWTETTFPITPGYYNYWLWRKFVSGWDVFGEQYWLYDANGNEIYSSNWNTGDRHGASNVTDPDGFFRLDANQTVFRLSVPESGASMKIATASLSNAAQITQLIDDLILEPVEPTMSDITGRVVDANGVGVENAYVGFKFTPLALMDGAKKDWAITDADGYYTITKPLGKYYVAAYKDGYTVSGDTVVLAADSTQVAGTITLQAAADSLIYQRPDLLVTSPTGDGSLEQAVDGDAHTWWRAGRTDEIGMPQYLIAVFDDPTDLTDVVLFRSSEWCYGDAWQNFQLDIMTSGNPSDPDAWDDPASTVYSIYTNSNSTYGAQIENMVGLCAMPLTAKKALGLRMRVNDAHWVWPFIHVTDLQIHGYSQYGSAKSISGAKLLPVNTKVAVGGKQLTALCSTYDWSENYGVPANTAYIEEEDRSSGMRLDVGGLDLTSLQLGETIASVVGVVGTIKQTGAGEKYIKCDKIRWIEDKEPKLAPLGLNNRFAATGLAQGLYVKVWGTATKIGEDGYRAIYSLDDGSGSPIKLYTYYQSLIPTGTLVMVKGVVSKDGTETVVFATEIGVDY